MKYIATLLALAVFTFAFTGCNTVKVDIPASAEVSGNVTINAPQAIWKSNAVDDGEGQIDQTTSPTTDTSVGGL